MPLSSGNAELLDKDAVPGELTTEIRLFNFFTVHPAMSVFKKYMGGNRYSDRYFEFTYDWRKGPVTLA